MTESDLFFLEYPYRGTIEGLVDDISSLWERINFHPVLLQLFENICRISSSIDVYNDLSRNDSTQVKDTQRSFISERIYWSRIDSLDPTFTLK